MNAKQIIGFINTTIKGQRIVFNKPIDSEQAKKIIDTIIQNNIPSYECYKEVVDYCMLHYDYE